MFFSLQAMLGGSNPQIYNIVYFDNIHALLSQKPREKRVSLCHPRYSGAKQELTIQPEESALTP
jgi:hypothetical protein